MASKDCPIVIPYMGGKVSLSRILSPTLPEHRFYIEVFAGGLSMFFRKKPCELSILNDLNSDISNLYYVLSQPDLFEQFMHRAYWLVSSREIYKHVEKNFVEQSFTFPSVEQAVLYYYYIKTSFNNRLNAGWNTYKAWNTYELEILKLSRDKLNNATIENCDYRDLIDKHKVKPESLWYFDPPYVVTDTASYYKYNFNINDHQIMFNKINELLFFNPTAKIIISYDDVDFIREMYKNWHIKTIPVKHTTKLGVVSNELVITNYKMIEQTNLEFGD
jgi:DNA adenine methylase